MRKIAIVGLLAMSCGSSDPPVDDAVLYEVIFDELTLYVFTVGKDCRDFPPIEIAVAVEKADPPVRLLERLARPCFDFVPGSEHEPHSNSRLDFTSVGWADDGTAEIGTTVQYRGGNGFTALIRVGRVEGGWKITAWERFIHFQTTPK